ncbi:MAG: 50S ribosomal protein L15 [Sphingomonadaceae bacterium]|uniref:50S ribosomal protein L15 n=1 Tax=Thermaurantiacus sp. TaxID=2820283 RepID=UPI00298EDF1C|nr:50S ribosomal protein L15 [Thermaurantiacus sp.]MCS6986444.1 50S ribosomal protein L15 [Sphingomonadaceae bacterium]MDW8414295.1 50S ribosomal protein L15 [Thermaurantiacus sp.]
MNLNELKDNPGAREPRTRVGRGIGSGKGKTCGRGQKGQKSRSGAGTRGFEGGQMPLHMRLPKRGFTNPLRRQYAVVNLDRLQQAVDAGRIAEGSRVDGPALKAAGVVRHLRDGVRLLGRGELKARLDLVVAHASAGARRAVEAAGGTVIEQRPKGRAAEA